MDYQYAGRTYYLTLNNDGKIKCDEFIADTVEEVKELIRASIAREKSEPRIKILVYENNRWGENAYFEGTASAKRITVHGNQYSWIVWKNGNGKNEHEKENCERIILDTPDNRKKLDLKIELNKQILELEKQVNIIDKGLEYIQKDE